MIERDDSEDFRIVGCEACGTEGRVQHITHTYVDFRNGGIVECGWEEDCEACEGTGGEIIPVEPITLDDLVEMNP
jgi:hypothetical protein